MYYTADLNDNKQVVESTCEPTTTRRLAVGVFTSKCEPTKTRLLAVGKSAVKREKWPGNKQVIAFLLKDCQCLHPLW